MFENDAYRLFGVPLGVDFPKAVLRGLDMRLSGKPPEAWARTTLIVNTRRMQRRLTQLFAEGPARLLPRIILLNDIDVFLPNPPPPAEGALRRELELAQLIDKLIASNPDLAPKAHVFDLAGSLAALIDEMEGESVDPEALLSLDMSGHSGYWEQTSAFISLAQRYLADGGNGGPEWRQSQIVSRLAQLWEQIPPTDPIIVAGSTGSRGTTFSLMTLLAQQAVGAVIMPGFDPNIDEKSLSSEFFLKSGDDHPQHRLVAVAHSLGVPLTKIAGWSDCAIPDARRHKTVSLSLRPAPVTDAWITQGPELGDLASALDGVTLVETETPRSEALTIALRLRQAAQDGQTAALITPDRVLTRQVTAALDQWNIVPDDSAGTPLHLSPPGRFLRHAAERLTEPLTAEALLTILKHPLTHSGADRNLHQLNTQRFELRMRRDGAAFPTAQDIQDTAERALPAGSEDREQMSQWAAWLGSKLADLPPLGPRPLGDWVESHIRLAEDIVSGPGGDANALWDKAAGREAKRIIETLRQDAAFGGVISGADYQSLLRRLLSAGEVRDHDAPHPGIMIWGTLEARVQGADLVILGGLNEGVWPGTPQPDPWLNRAMRKEAGLLVPERRIGLSAHDYQQAIAAPEVWLTRSIRSDEAETVPARWLNRLMNLLAGLPNQGGTVALAAMRKRGDTWKTLAQAFEDVSTTPKAVRPSPKLQNTWQPKSIRITEVETLIRDPYAFYARHWLRLSPLDPLVPTPEAAMRGSITHQVLEDFVGQTTRFPDQLNAKVLRDIIRRHLIATVPWPSIRALWIARLNRIAEWFVSGEIDRQNRAVPSHFETSGEMMLETSQVMLRGRADRIDVADGTRAILYDYKSGNPPSKDEQAHFNKQLVLETAMLEAGAFKSVPPLPVLDAHYIGLGNSPKIAAAPLAEDPPSDVLAKLDALLWAHLTGAIGFTARRAMQKVNWGGDYDLLSRYGEWDVTDPATAIEVEE